MKQTRLTRGAVAVVLAAVAALGADPAQAADPPDTPVDTRERLTLEEAAGDETATDAVDEETLEFVDSNVVSLVGRDGFRWQDRAGNYLFNPYVLLQTRLQFLGVDDEGLNLADPDNVVDAGFGVPHAILGIAGKAFGHLSFNLALDGGCAGRGCLLVEAWLEANVSEAFRIRTGKFKTPMHWNTQARLSQKLAPVAPASLRTRMNLPFDLNAASPVMATGFDVGVMVHGLVADRFRYEVGVFNGEGILVNSPTSTLSDDTSVPGLLYGGRVAWMPFGPMPLREGGPETSDDLRLSIAGSASWNVETNAESSDDLRAGLEVVLSVGSLYWATEAYLLHMSFVERMKGAPSRLFLGGYTQVAHAFEGGLEPYVRFEVFDRNSTDEGGVLLLPAAGLNWYVSEQNVKLQAYYQYLARAGHEDAMAANDDDNSMAEHAVHLQLQFAF